MIYAMYITVVENGALLSLKYAATSILDKIVINAYAFGNSALSASASVRGEQSAFSQTRPA